MTTGSIIADDTVTQILGCGSSKVGGSYSKTWNGGDRSGNANTRFSEEHPYTMSESSKFNGAGTFTRRDKTTFTGTIDSCFGGISTPSAWTSNDDIALLGKLREAVAGSSFNAGVALAESPRSLDMIFESANRIARALKETRKGKFFNAYQALTGLDQDGKVIAGKYSQSDVMRGRKYPKYNHRVFSTKENVASNWLQLQYGWLPLLQDAKEGAEFLAHQHGPKKYKVRVRRRIVRPVLSASPPNTSFVGQITERGQIVATLTEVNVTQLSGLLDPMSVAWELVPYSFVIDWFIPIGNYLSARGLAQSLTGSFVTTKTKRVRARLGAFPGRLPSSVASFSGIYSASSFNLTRTVSTSLAIPKPAVKPLGEVFSWKRAANAVALLINANR